MSKEKTIRKGFVYYSERDKDIHEWLDSLPERSQSESIKEAIRYYLNNPQQQNDGQSYNSEILNNLMNEINNLKERVKTLEELSLQNSNEKTSVSNENSNDPYIDATEIIKNLGK